MYICRMNDKERNNLLFNQARSLRMCDGVHKAWYGRVLSVDELFDLYYRNLDFCLDFRWPDAKAVRELFSDEERHKHGVVANEKWSLLNPTHSIVMGDSEAKIRYNGFAVGKATVTGRSKCDITAKGHAYVVVDVYDDACVTVSSEEQARVTVIKNSKNCKLSCLGQTTIKECI